MYLTLWTLRVSPLYVYRHFTLCLTPAIDSIYYTLHVLDSMCIVTLCLSSIIIYVLLSMASYRRTRLRGNPKSSNFTSRSCARPRQFPQRVAREPCGNLIKVATLPRVRALDHANPRKGLRLKVATLPRVRALDHANPCKGLHPRWIASVLVPALEREIDIPRCRQVGLDVDKSGTRLDVLHSLYLTRFN